MAAVLEVVKPSYLLKLTVVFAVAMALLPAAEAVGATTDGAAKEPASIGAPKSSHSKRAKPSAASRKKRTARKKSAPLYRAVLLQEVDTGKVLKAENADIEWPPASMAKMMLLLVADEQVDAGRFTLDDLVRVSERAAATGGSGIGLKPGQIYPLGDLMKAALIRSANDAAVAVAEKIAGSVEAMVWMMNLRARELGLSNTEYGTVDGLPPRPAQDVDRTNAYDLAALGRELIKRARLMSWASQPIAPFGDGTMMLKNTNHLVGEFYGCDGLKTGFTSQAGFNLTATAKRGDMRLVAVVLGAPSNKQRFAQAARVMEWGFDNFRPVSLIRAGETLPVHVQVGSGPIIQPVAARDVKLVLPRGSASDYRIEYRVPAIVDGPLQSGATVGTVLVRDKGEIMTEVAAVCPIDVVPPSQFGPSFNGYPPPSTFGRPGNYGTP
jgi:D-alanyl-D-alanine carboxypeptidase (penicillin-binding protein 5/6)